MRRAHWIILIVVLLLTTTGGLLLQLTSRSGQPTAPVSNTEAPPRKSGVDDPILSTSAGETEVGTLDVYIPPKHYNDGLGDLKYADIQPDSLMEDLRGIPTIDEELAGAEKLEILLTELEECLWAYKKGSDELILADRLRAPYVYNERIMVFQSLADGKTSLD